jgi:hypothetical protein
VTRSVAVAAAAAAVLTAAIAAQGASAATISPPTISTQYTPNQIGTGQTTGITYTITDPNASGSLYQVSFADTLPSTSAVDNPPAVTNSGCGSAVSVNATPGATSVSASAITVKAGTPCTISVAVIGNAAGTASDSYSSFLYTSSSATYAIPGPAPTSGETPASLQVIGAPTITISSPVNNAVFRYGQKVKASFACTAGAGDQQSQLTCIAFDDIGNSLNSGQDLDTKVAGTHQLDVQAISGLTGDTTDATVNYTVLPDNAFKITKTKANAKGALAVTLALPGPGSVAAAETSGKIKVSFVAAKVRREGKLTLTLTPSKAAKAALAKHDGKLNVKLTVVYAPKGGHASKATKAVTI